MQPLTRGECREWVRPCVLTACRFHLGEMARPGATETCALDVADAGEHSAGQIALTLATSKCGIEGIEARAARRVREHADMFDVQVIEHVASRDAVLRVLRARGPMRRCDLFVALAGDMGTATVSRALAKLQAEGQVACRERGVWAAA